MPSHQLDYEILGASAQSVEIILDPGETVIAEAGAMNYMTDGVRFETRMGDGSSSGLLGKLWSVRRVLTQEERPADAAADDLHYQVIAGEHVGEAGACSADDFRAWARFEVVPQGRGRWMKAD